MLILSSLTVYFCGQNKFYSSNLTTLRLLSIGLMNSLELVLQGIPLCVQNSFARCIVFCSLLISYAAYPVSYFVTCTNRRRGVVAGMICLVNPSFPHLLVEYYSLIIIFWENINRIADCLVLHRFHDHVIYMLLLYMSSIYTC